MALKTLDKLNPMSKSRTLWPSEGVKYMVTDTLPLTKQKTFQDPTIGPDDIAFLQFTSGSTSTPKGVKVTHSSLSANISLYLNGFNGTFQDKRDGDPNKQHIACSWLPQYQ